ncbi:hypothetical protein L0F63_000061 [Massospora cicadina]|nr:hypothetical protein L0F63_000061 [Massospora cicadina]
MTGFKGEVRLAPYLASLTPPQPKNDGMFELDAGKPYAVLGIFAVALPILSRLESARSRVAAALKDIERSRAMLHLHISDVYLEPLIRLVREGIPVIKESKRRFDKASDEHDAIIGRYMNRKETDRALESHPDYLRQRVEFRDRCLAYAQELKQFQMATQIEASENTLSLMYAFQTFHHQGYEILKDSDPLLKELADRLQKLRVVLKRDDEETSHIQELLLQRAGVPGAIYVAPVWYFETWNRYYFKIDDDTLTYYHRDKAMDAVGTIDLKLCTVKVANTDRRFCFLIVSNSRSYLLQAETEARAKLWISTLNKAIENALKFNRNHWRAPNVTGATLTPQPAAQSTLLDSSPLDRMRLLPGNDRCADCKAYSPTWACTNFGILIRIECSGIHRSFGVHLSKIRSLTLDHWEPAAVEVSVLKGGLTWQIMLALGNHRVNQVLEHKLRANDGDATPDELRVEDIDRSDGPKPIASDSSREEKADWITAKYVARQFCPPQARDGFEASRRLIEALESDDYPLSLQLMLQGAALETLINGSTILHRAVLTGNFTRLEFLLMWSADLWAHPLHVAATTANPQLVWFLLQKGADWERRDLSDKLPLDYALELPDVPVVMAFRYFVFLKQSHPNLSRDSSFDLGRAVELFAAAPE